MADLDLELQLVLDRDDDGEPADGQPHPDVKEDEGEEGKEEEEEEGSLKEELRGVQRCAEGRLLSYVAMEWVTEKRPVIIHKIFVSTLVSLVEKPPVVDLGIVEEWSSGETAANPQPHNDPAKQSHNYPIINLQVHTSTRILCY